MSETRLSQISARIDVSPPSSNRIKVVTSFVPLLGDKPSFDQNRSAGGAMFKMLCDFPIDSIGCGKGTNAALSGSARAPTNET